MDTIKVMILANTHVPTGIFIGENTSKKMSSKTVVSHLTMSLHLAQFPSN